jgi:hypothetical protein
MLEVVFPILIVFALW